MSKNKIYLVVFFLVLFVALIIVFQASKDPLARIKSFADCKAAGYPVIATNDITICTLPNTKTFTENNTR
jgi:hypothetical protein